MSDRQDNQAGLTLNQSIRSHYDLTKNQADFIEAYLQTGSISKASEIAGVHRTSHYMNLAHNQRYVEAFETARKTIGAQVIDVLAQRAIHGDTRKKFTGRGEPIIDPATGKQYEETYYDTVAQIFLAKSLGGLRDQDTATKAGTNNVQVVVNLPEKELPPTIEVTQQNMEEE